MDELRRWREEFPILASTTYMISNSLGAMPRGTAAALQEYARAWAERGVRAWHEGWWEMPLTIGDRLTGILGAAAGSIAMQPNVSLAQSIVLSCFDYEPPRNTIVSTEMNFPSVLYVLWEQRRRGARLRLIPTDDGVTVDTQRLLEAIDEETLLVCISHALFRSAFLQDVPAVTERAHAVGAKVVLDVYQSAGCVPLRLAEWGVDFAVGGTLKWLCGGPGAAYLYVRPDLAASLNPMVTGWQAHAQPFAFEPGAMQWGDPGWRLLNGTPVIPALYAVREGIAIVGRIGVDRIREHSVELTGIILDEARAAGLKTTCPEKAEQRGGTVALDVPHGEEVCRELLRREFLVDYRPRAGIRVSPHFYSTTDECRATVAETVRILDERGWR
ncbi:MAG: aminotransferase class V-fold PLP-dependent enzyme [Candidatus Eisenbacteria bacterium]|nr:aminotransferase class V-fold PLP-dependent enzyme [Candidatus Eisenbacteria bacterium]